MPGQWWDSVVERWRQVSPETRPWTWTPPPPPPVQSIHPHSAVQSSKGWQSDLLKLFSKIICSYSSLTLNCLQCVLWWEDCCAVNVKWSVVMQIMHWLSRLKTARRISDTIYNSYNSHTHNLQSTVLFPNVNSILESPTFSWKESCSEPLNTFSIPQTERFFWYSTSTLDLKRVLPQTTFSQWFKGCHMALIHPGLEVSTATGEGWAI